MPEFNLTVFKPGAIMVHGMQVKAAMSNGYGFRTIPMARWVELVELQKRGGMDYWQCRPLEAPDNFEPYLVPQRQLYQSLSAFEKTGSKQG